MKTSLVFGAFATLALTSCASNYGHWDGDRTKVRVRLGGEEDRYTVAEYAEFLAALPDSPRALDVSDGRVLEFLQGRIAEFVADPALLLRPGHYVIVHRCGSREVFNEVYVEPSTASVVLTAPCE